MLVDKLYRHTITLITDIIPIENEAFDFVESNSYKITGNIEKIILLADSSDYNPLRHKDIDIVEKYSIDSTNCNINISLPREEDNWWGLEINTESHKLYLFNSKTPPQRFSFKIIGNCHIRELILHTNIKSPEIYNPIHVPNNPLLMPNPIEWLNL